ncbi:MAG: DUF368 domain-containing protein [Putridiphycobacter sp.]|nr:DUF368 domain-containing protein [Putridiphycobacter sp.]
MESSKSKVLLFLKGYAMGAADVVPGVSGGTIAFITGIYETLLESISKFDKSIFSKWKNEGFKAVWQHINGSFLSILLLGIATSLISLAKLVEYLLAHHPIPVWSFFFGLVLASVWLVGRTVEKWNLQTISALIFGTIVAYGITILPPFADSSNLVYIFFCGSLAICAMILPGISGSFILILLGAYSTVLGAISNLISGILKTDSALIFTNGSIIAVFAIGCVVGLLSFSRLLNYLFKKSKTIVIAVLTGFLIGSLNKIWPWKKTLTSFIKHAGEANEELVPLTQQNISPQTFTTLHHTNNELGVAITFLLVGITLLIVLDQFKIEEKA